MADIGKLEYRVRKTERYTVTRYHEGVDGRTGGSEVKGEYANEEVAYEVAYALCKAEHDRLRLPPGDERIKYPHPPGVGVSVPASAAVDLGSPNVAKLR